MESISTDWTKEEFKAYVLLWAAENNVAETRVEERIIHEWVKDDIFKKMLNEIRHDNQFKRLSKIIHTADRLNFTNDEIEPLMEEVKKLFMTNDAMDMTEKSIYFALKHILTR